MIPSYSPFVNSELADEKSKTKERKLHMLLPRRIYLPRNKQERGDRASHAYNFDAVV